MISLILLIIFQRHKTRKLTSYELESFQNGNVEFLNPKLNINYQGNLLPYDKIFEFSRKKLHIEKELGRGEFGMVMQATARKILPHQDESKVAVKMIKNSLDRNAFLALISELKILIHAGQHMNIVNLLGAVTKNISKGELFIILEFCELGSLQNFLIDNRARFEEKSEDEAVEILSPSYVSFTTAIKSDSKTLNANDLICWSFQCSRGMNYLSSRKILHGDLATRNILLCEQNVVKISDFGLAKSLYKCENYNRKTEILLPFRWLAIECIVDNIYSVYSDVWAFGKSQKNDEIPRNLFLYLI